MIKEALAAIPADRRRASSEWVGYVPLFKDGRLGRFCPVAAGHASHVSFEAQDLFASLLALRPFGFVLFHNHPSGVAKPSAEDRVLTAAVAALSESLGLRFLGHWVVTISAAAEA